MKISSFQMGCAAVQSNGERRHLGGSKSVSLAALSMRPKADEFFKKRQDATFCRRDGGAPQILALIMFLFFAPLFAQEEDKKPEEISKQHKEGSAKLANEQDELSADVQQLVAEQTVPQVIKLLNEVRDIMGETTDRLADSDTGGDTIAAETEIIEKIHDAAKARQKANQSGVSESGSAMMDMMERMMGKEPQPKEGKEGKGKNPGQQSGNGTTGESDSENGSTAGPANGAKEEARRVPRAAGNAGVAIPEEFRKAFDAYNRAAEEKAKVKRSK